MSFESILHDFSRTISGNVADLEDKITRLKSAKSKINKEQNLSLTEIRKILKPELEDKWKGERATSFEEKRTNAHSNIKEIITNDYDDYVQTIESKISWLETQKGFFSGVSGLVGEAESLLAKGEDAIADLENKISEIRSKIR
ncbi:DUF5082 domain-containing protein [Priestia megaterium]|nr:DUF5082 domain-containing protein [Priestia megaterium]